MCGSTVFCDSNGVHSYVSPISFGSGYQYAGIIVIGAADCRPSARWRMEKDGRPLDLHCLEKKCDQDANNRDDNK